VPTSASFAWRCRWSRLLLFDVLRVGGAPWNRSARLAPEPFSPFNTAVMGVDLVMLDLFGLAARDGAWCSGRDSARSSVRAGGGAIPPAVPAVTLFRHQRVLAFATSSGGTSCLDAWPR